MNTYEVMFWNDDGKLVIESVPAVSSDEARKKIEKMGYEQICYVKSLTLRTR